MAVSFFFPDLLVITSKGHILWLSSLFSMVGAVFFFSTDLLFIITDEGHLLWVSSLFSCVCRYTRRWSGSSKVLKFPALRSVKGGACYLLGKLLGDSYRKAGHPSCKGGMI
ncbi:uncharacterized protein LOC126410017 [Nymphaea colorata]|uniref:uncharacterized protein LOC126410017 n=1 Tax=Nymphaea colorata TaxID=210225 RepID=UPI00214EDBBD|nr:uncharacterized protein LOC126410017 [Nymphaea colorata]